MLSGMHLSILCTVLTSKSGGTYNSVVMSITNNIRTQCNMAKQGCISRRCHVTASNRHTERPCKCSAYMSPLRKVLTHALTTM
jgi:hypothetical protein